MLHSPPAEVWSGVRIAGDTPLEGVSMRLAATTPSTGRMVVKPPALGSDLVAPAVPALNPALLAGALLAYLSVRRLPGADTKVRFELGAIGHGPQGEHLARQIIDRTRDWDVDRTAIPEITAHQTGMPVENPDGVIIEKNDSMLVVSLR
ncbi:MULTISPECIES: hypothetical protein [unclassified Nocardiopsis]|uniref:hypothetical protein n=1 Tax=Nocardiopsis TaxID=2013 RepID=UPI00387B5CF5